LRVAELESSNKQLSEYATEAATNLTATENTLQSVSQELQACNCNSTAASGGGGPGAEKGEERRILRNLLETTALLVCSMGALL
jgi:hypothetical protein